MTDKKKADQQASLKKSHIHDTSGDAQRLRLLVRLQLGPGDTFTARDELNILMPAGCVKRQRCRGHGIRCQLITLTDDQGRPHHGIALHYRSNSTTPTQAEA
jgi:hypothetical protein